jgi:hypothetical protein
VRSASIDALAGKMADVQHILDTAGTAKIGEDVGLL